MTRNVLQDEKDKFTTNDDGNVAVRLEPTTGDNPDGVANMNVLLLTKEVFTLNDAGEVAVRTVGASASDNEFLFEFMLDNMFWVPQGTTPETFKLSVTHNLNTNTPDIQIFETDGTPTEMCIEIESSERISITLFANEIFAGYIYVRK